jgi:hypothetical protein
MIHQLGLHRQKITILPLHSAEHNLLVENESLNLGYGVSVERCKELLASADLWIWTHKRAQDDEEEIKGWDTCLVHRYRSEPVTGERDEDSIRLMAYVLAHLRLINPHRDSVDDNIQLQEELPGDGYSGFRCSKAAFRPTRFLCDCESAISGINRAHLNDLRTFMPWIADFAPHWRSYYPLWLSMYFLEESYKPGHTLRTCHLFRVMALEALFCSEFSFGKRALTGRIPKLLGTGLDLYECYRVDFLNLPRMELTVGIIKDIYTLRNKIAHSDKLPAIWQDTVSRQGLNEPITYLGQLLEAATSIVRLSWLKTIRGGLQSTFSDKQKMQAYLR